MNESTHLKLWETFLSGLAGAVIAAAVTYWGAVEKSKNEAILKNSLADSKEQYLEQIKDSIALIAKAEANAENAVINSQKFITNLASIEERANAILVKLTSIEKNSNTQSINLDKKTLDALKNNLVNDIASIEMPPKAIIAFNLVNCPQGWNEYVPAYGRFLRGIDKTGRGDSDGIRLPGHLQESSILKHSHGIGVNGADTTTVVPGGATQRLAHFKNDGYGGGGQKRTGSEGGNEIRPKNVALLFCIKD
jgi:hypothetical protein